MSQALYRKYRSRAFDQIVGQEHITDTLTRALKAGSVNHAYLFTGPHGTGKTSIARVLAHAINDLPYSDAPNLDIVEIDAASNRRIDDIRDLREKVHIAPIAAKYKIYIIDEVHMLTGESFNALLKTLEEPPSHVVFMLATTEAHKLPATIISRTQRFALRSPSTEKIVSLLKDIATKEKLKITESALQLIAEHGNGSFRDSVSLLDQMAHVATGEITAEAVQHTLGLAPKATLNSLIVKALQGNSLGVAGSLKELEDQGSSPSALVQQITQVLSEQASDNPQLFALIDRLLEVPRAYNPSLKLLSVLMLFTTQQTGETATTKTVSSPKTRKSAGSEDTVRDKSKTAATMAAATPALSITVPKPIKTDKALSPVENEDEPDANEPAKLADLPLKDWVKLLQAIKKTDTPLFSVLKQAEPRFDKASNTLTLAFKYQLHRKKMDGVKIKNSVISFMRSKLGGTAVIATELDPKAKPPVLSDDPAVTSVAAIMGGGDVVDAEKI